MSGRIAAPVELSSFWVNGEGEQQLWCSTPWALLVLGLEPFFLLCKHDPSKHLRCTVLVLYTSL